MYILYKLVMYILSPLAFHVSDKLMVYILLANCTTLRIQNLWSNKCMNVLGTGWPLILPKISNWLLSWVETVTGWSSNARPADAAVAAAEALAAEDNAEDCRALDVQKASWRWCWWVLHAVQETYHACSTDTFMEEDEGTDGLSGAYTCLGISITPAFPRVEVFEECMATDDGDSELSGLCLRPEHSTSLLHPQMDNACMPWEERCRCNMSKAFLRILLLHGPGHPWGIRCHPASRASKIKSWYSAIGRGLLVHTWEDMWSFIHASIPGRWRGGRFRWHPSCLSKLRVLLTCQHDTLSSCEVPASVTVSSLQSHTS
jgi:hypothetical protein